MRSKANNGFTLVELLIALALMAALLSALAAGVHASLQNYDENDKIAQTTQTSRAVLDRLSSDIRTADDLTTTATSVTITPPANDQNLAKVVYSWKDGALTYSQTIGTQTKSYTLLDGSGDVKIQNFSVAQQMGKDFKGTNCIVNVTINMTLIANGNSYPYSICAAPRRNQTF